MYTILSLTFRAEEQSRKIQKFSLKVLSTMNSTPSSSSSTSKFSLTSTTFPDPLNFDFNTKTQPIPDVSTFRVPGSSHYQFPTDVPSPSSSNPNGSGYEEGYGIGDQPTLFWTRSSTYNERDNSKNIPVEGSAAEQDAWVRVNSLK
jgi:hypothetical protein